MSHGSGHGSMRGGGQTPNAGSRPAEKDELSFGAEGTAEEMRLLNSTGEHGLTTAQAKAQLDKWGYNALPEKKINPFLLFLSYLWGPMPIMIWLAIIIEVGKGTATNEGWEDVGVLLALQFANAIIGFIEEKNAGDAIAALKAKLAPMAHVCRDGSFRNMEARLLVPGDLIELAIGNIIPADARLCAGAKPMQIDQAALTGESLPVTKHGEEKLLMGSAVKQGEAHAVVVATGSNTFFGKAAGLINSVVTQGRLQLVLLRITASLLIVSLLLCAIIFAFLMLRTDLDPLAVAEGENRVLAALSVVIVILVASIPIAIEVVCTSTLAVGSHMMSEKGIIVARLSAIEELAGMNVLCSDKTGTLTKNKLELQTPIVLSDSPPCDVVFYAALCSKRAVGNQDAIDFAICDDKSNGGLLKDALAVRNYPLSAFKELDFIPFNPTDKRTMSRVQMPDGTELEISKGAPMVILKMAHNSAEIAPTVKGYVQDLADRGFRALGVAINLNQPDAPEKKWDYVGILSIFDPPRDDTKATIAAAVANGIMVKMVTGDHGAIARETCRTLGMGDNILNTTTLDDPKLTPAQLDQKIMSCDGFAEVMPEHKFKIVERVRAMGNVCGMTGDGVNDAPALKRADVGIAVAGATDAARAAADLVLTDEGLSVIIDAIFESRKIFQRMRNYIIYRIACTIQLLVFFFIAILLINPDAAYYFNESYCTSFNAGGAPIVSPAGKKMCDGAPAATLANAPVLWDWTSSSPARPGYTGPLYTGLPGGKSMCCKEYIEELKPSGEEGIYISSVDNKGFINYVMASNSTTRSDGVILGAAGSWKFLLKPEMCAPESVPNCKAAEPLYKSLKKFILEEARLKEENLAPLHDLVFGWPYPNVPMPSLPQPIEPGKPAPPPIAIPAGWWPYPRSTFVPQPSESKTALEASYWPNAAIFDVTKPAGTSPYQKTGMIPFAHDFQNNVLVHAQAFTLPVISMVLITILNDGCMITISHDRVVSEKWPQKWKLFEATTVAIGLGMVACISTIFLLVGLMHNNLAQGTSAVNKFIGSNGREYVTWYEIRTIIYLKVSVSDFLTLFSARTRTWFWERSVGGPLLIAACVALFCSTMFALFWATLPNLNAGSYMASLKDSQGAAFCTWIYCILWWLIQDAFKVYTYFLLDLRSEQGSWSAALGAQWDIINGRAPPPPAKSFKNPLPSATAGAKDGARPTSADW